MKENLSYQPHRGRRGPSRARWSRRRSRCRSASACGSASTRSARTSTWRSSRSGCARFGVDAEAIAAARQEALVWALERGSRSRPRRLPVRPGLRRKAPRVSVAARRRRAGAGIVDVAVRRADRRRRRAFCSPRGRPARSTPATGSSRAASSRPASRSEQALRRELHEELGITIGAAQPWQVDAAWTTRMRACACTSARCFDWRGEFEMREGQAMAWQTLPVDGRAGAARHAAGAATGSPPSRVSPARPHRAGGAATLTS